MSQLPKEFRLQFSLANLQVEFARGSLADTLYDDLLNKKVVQSGFGIGIIKTEIIGFQPFFRFFIVHPDAAEILIYKPNINITVWAFWNRAGAPIPNSTEPLHRFWPLGEEALCIVIERMEKYLAELMKDYKYFYRPILPAWRVYHGCRLEQ